MIRCERVAPPGHFEVEVRRPGMRWLETRAVGRPPRYWQAVREDLEQAFNERCAYSALRIAGLGTVDHFDAARELLYEWGNYRYSAGWINSSKQYVPSTRLLDPCEIEDGWFELVLPSLDVRVGRRCPEELRGRAEYTIARLQLSGERLKRLREKHLQLYQSGHMSLPMLDEWDPLLARALRGSGEDGEARAG